MQVFVATPANQFNCVQIPLDKPVRIVKRTIAEMIGIPVEIQLLTHNGRNLRDDRRCVEYGIKEGSTIHVSVLLRGGGCWSVTVHTLQGKQWDFYDVDPSSRVGDLLGRVAKIDSLVRPQQHWLMCMGKGMRDTDMIREAAQGRVKNGSHIYVNIRVVGGHDSGHLAW